MGAVTRFWHLGPGSFCLYSLFQPVWIRPSSLSHPNGHLFMVKSPLAVNSFYSGKRWLSRVMDRPWSGWYGLYGLVRPGRSLTHLFHSFTPSHLFFNSLGHLLSYTDQLISTGLRWGCRIQHWLLLWPCFLQWSHFPPNFPSSVLACW